MLEAQAVKMVQVQHRAPIRWKEQVGHEGQEAPQKTTG
jgi:hypothetical protein